MSDHDDTMNWERITSIKRYLDAAEQAHQRGDLPTARWYLTMAKQLRAGQSHQQAAAEAAKQAEDRVMFLGIHAATVADAASTLPPPGGALPPAA